MSYSPAMQILVDEHEVILGALEALEIVAQDQRRLFESDFYVQAFDFFPAFADQCHHAKEEDHLFPVLERRGIAKSGGPIGCMLYEHDEGRAHVRAIKKALAADPGGQQTTTQDTIRREALQFVQLLRQHIQKENEILFIMGDRMMTEQDKTDLVQKFNCTAHSPLPVGSHEKYIALAGELRRRAGLSDQFTGRDGYAPNCLCAH
ncbi:MAG: hypothetical protein HJJLKODD_02691 [Phycisphaerae bacterium]|nr:hypothetical protein [Phycisphaerae bacterium]